VSEPLISLRNLSKFFTVDTNLFGRTTSVLKAVDDLSLDIFPGETFGLVGESGCGKTTVGKMLVSLYEPTAGEIWYQGRDLTKIKQKARRSVSRDRKSVV
jgi:peptide/nickel transport system ATP-binding protein